MNTDFEKQLEYKESVMSRVDAMKKRKSENIAIWTICSFIFEDLMEEVFDCNLQRSIEFREGKDHLSIFFRLNDEENKIYHSVKRILFFSQIKNIVDLNMEAKFISKNLIKIVKEYLSDIQERKTK